MERSMNEQEKSREIQREEDMSQGQTVIPADRQTERERESNRLDFQTGGKKRQRDACHSNRQSYLELSAIPK